MAYRNDVEALAARADALGLEVKAKSEELERAAVLLQQARDRAKLPVLDNIRIASPCTADWNAMTGDERVRHCGSCKKDVFNLSALTRDEAEALIRDKAGDLCGRYFQRSDGTILLADCTIGKAKKRKRFVIAAGVVSVFAIGGVARYLDHRTQRTTETLGGQVSFGDQHAVAGGLSFEPPPPPPPVADEPLQEVKGDVERAR